MYDFCSVMDNYLRPSSKLKGLFTQQMIFVSCNTFRCDTTAIRNDPIVHRKVLHNVGRCRTKQK
jgi:hypothetical protein